MRMLKGGYRPIRLCCLELEINVYKKELRSNGHVWGK